MISGKGASETAAGKRGAFYNTLEELRTHFDRIDIVCPKALQLYSSTAIKLFGNVYFHPTNDIVGTGLAIYRKEKFDVMTVHEYAPFRNGRGANALWKKIRVPMMFEIMHIPGFPRAGSIKEYIARMMMRLYIARDVRNASVVRVINSGVGRWLQNVGVPAEKIKLVPAMYIDLDIFKPMSLEKKYDVVYLGRRATNKGIDLFEEAIRKLRAKSYKLEALVIDGWAKDSHEIAQLLNQSRLLIMPSYNEGGPRVILEAMACGVPVLATRVGIVPDVLSDDRIIDWSAEDIAQKARKLLDAGTSESERAELVRTASRFEKHAAIRCYAESLHSVALP